MIECVFKGGLPRGELWRPGWVFEFGYDLSVHYRKLVARTRKPLSVVLPLRNDTRWRDRHGEMRGTLFCVDSAPSGNPDGHWTVEINGPLVVDEKPDITVRPSINALGIYHGYLTNGVLGDDLG